MSYFKENGVASLWKRLECLLFNEKNVPSLQRQKNVLFKDTRVSSPQREQSVYPLKRRRSVPLNRRHSVLFKEKTLCSPQREHILFSLGTFFSLKRRHSSLVQREATPFSLKRRHSFLFEEETSLGDGEWSGGSNFLKNWKIETFLKFPFENRGFINF